MGLGPSLLTSYPSARAAGGFRNRCLVSIAAGLLLAGCGDDDGDVERETPAGETARTTTTTETARPPAAPVPPREETGKAPAGRDRTTPESPEDRPGGAGDEVPARSQALFTGRAGAIRPRLVQVPPFIAIRVELRSADGRAYSLRFGDRSIAVGRDIHTASTVFDGLRPGRRLIGVGGTGRIVVEASAEPGP